MHVKHELITTDHQLEEFCHALADAERIAFDTEFVSEDTYRPQLCLVQVAAADRLAVIDPLKVQNLVPFWTVLADGGHETIVHAGRQEIEFSLAAIGRPPHRLFDVQIAAGMVGIEYPASYGSLVSKLLGLTPQKGETRTDWRKRPSPSGRSNTRWPTSTTWAICATSWGNGSPDSNAPPGSKAK